MISVVAETAEPLGYLNGDSLMARHGRISVASVPDGSYPATALLLNSVRT